LRRPALMLDKVKSGKREFMSQVQVYAQNVEADDILVFKIALLFFVWAILGMVIVG
jgi:hypothetical protein